MIRCFRKTRYILVEEPHHDPELGDYRSFGIAAVRCSFQGRETMASVKDVSTNRAVAAALVRRCNRGRLSPVHLRDYILDTLGN